jgi:hypothetical protein
MQNTITPKQRLIIFLGFFFSSQMADTTTTVHKQSKNESFTIGTYNGISIVIRDKDGYININKLVDEINQKENKGRKLRNYLSGEKWHEIVNEWRSAQKQADPKMEPIIDLINVGNEFKGKYVNKDLIHFICEWASIKYAFKVKHIMDTINGLVHVELHKNKLPDTPTNATPILNKIHKSLRQQLLDQMETIDDKDSYVYRDLQANVDALDENDKFNIVLYEKSMRDSSDKMF